MLKLLKYLKAKEWWLIVLSVVLIVFQVWLDLKMPDYLKIINQMIANPSSKIAGIWKNGIYMLLCAVGSLGGAIVVGFLAAKIATAFSARLREEVFAKTLSFSMEEINSFSTSSLITRTTNDITQVQTVIAMGLQIMIKAPILAIWAIAKISVKSWQWTASTGIAVLFLLIMISLIVLFALPKFKIIQKLTDNLNRATRENLTGLRVVRSFNAETYQENKFEKANEELTRTHLFTSRMMAIMMPGMTIVMSGLNLAIYWVGAYLINAVQINMGTIETDVMTRINLWSEMGAFSSIAMQIVMAFMMMTMIFIILPRASVSAKRINEVLDKKPTIVDGHINEADTTLKGEIEFKNVCFKYPDAANYVLKNISFKAHKGETVAFIGSTGSGKSTLINLVPRFYDATEGEILIDGIDIKKYTLETLHNKMGYIPQRAVIFSGTVSSNVTYGSQGQIVDEEQIKKAVKIAQATRFVEKMENMYQAPIAQGGANISGGQKQRLAIARAVCKNPEVYIFDDSFSALDYKTDRKLRSVLKKETTDATKLIVAQRIGTIRDADRIIVLDHGEIMGMGTHDELMKSCSVYQEIAYSQLSKEEL